MSAGAHVASSIWVPAFAGISSFGSVWMVSFSVFCGSFLVLLFPAAFFRGTGGRSGALAEQGVSTNGLFDGLFPESPPVFLPLLLLAARNTNSLRAFIIFAGIYFRKLVIEVAANGGSVVNS